MPKPTLRTAVLTTCTLALAVAGLAVAATRGPAGAAQPAAPRQTGPLVKLVAAQPIPIPAAAGGNLDSGLAIDGAGNVYVTVTNSATVGPDIAVLTPEGRLLRRWSTAPDHPSAGSPVLAIGPDGLVYVQNDNEDYVRVFTPEGSEVRARRMQHDVQNAKDIEVDAQGNVYVVARGLSSGPQATGARRDDHVVRMNPAGQITGILVARPGEGSDEALRGLAVAPDGSVYITVGSGFGRALYHVDASNRVLEVFDPTLFLPGGYIDVEYANGRLYFMGVMRGPANTDHTKVAAAAFTTDGRLLDFTVGTLSNPNYFHQLAVRGEHVYIPGLHIGDRSLHRHGNELGHLINIEAHRGSTSAGASNCNADTDNRLLNVPLVSIRGQQPNCRPYFLNKKNPCGYKGPAPRNPRVFLGGEQVNATVEDWGDGSIFVQLPAGTQQSGSVIVELLCRRAGGDETIYEWKGEVAVHDPSGNVLDAKTGRPVAAATVRLLFSLRPGGPFGTPAVSGFTPQVNPQITGKSGFFGWDVAEGFWRLRITAYGYKPLTSPVYRVPPEVTGLQLRLQPNPRQQSLLIDLAAGRVGNVRLGGKAPRGRVGGLQLRLANGRIRGITVRSGRYRTIQGIKLGSPSDKVFEAFPSTVRALAKQQPAVARVRAGKGTFTVRRGRVVAIVLGR